MKVTKEMITAYERQLENIKGAHWSLKDIHFQSELEVILQLNRVAKNLNAQLLEYHPLFGFGIISNHNSYYLYYTDGITFITAKCIQVYSTYHKAKKVYDLLIQAE